MTETKLLPCPFCGDTPQFKGSAEDWQDEHRYVELSLTCCVTMTEAIGWRQAKDLTVEARTSELQTRLTKLWNTRRVDNEDEDEDEAGTVSSHHNPNAESDANDIENKTLKAITAWTDLAQSIRKSCAANAVAALKEQSDRHVKDKVVLTARVAELEGVIKAALPALDPLFKAVALTALSGNVGEIQDSIRLLKAYGSQAKDHFKALNDVVCAKNAVND